MKYCSLLIVMAMWVGCLAGCAFFTANTCQHEDNVKLRCIVYQHLLTKKLGLVAGSKSAAGHTFVLTEKCFPDDIRKFISRRRIPVAVNIPVRQAKSGNLVVSNNGNTATEVMIDSLEINGDNATLMISVFEASEAADYYIYELEKDMGKWGIKSFRLDHSS